jgi:CBS domain-containing protein
MKVAKLMARDVRTCTLNDTANTAARIMWENDCGCVPALNGEGRLAGIITDRDICMAAYTQGLTLSMIRAASAMARAVVTCAPDDDVGTAEALMRQNQVRRLPVVDSQGELVGLISLSDIARATKLELGSQGGPALAEELAETFEAVTKPRAHTGIPVQFGLEEGEEAFKPSPPKKRGPWRR